MKYKAVVFDYGGVLALNGLTNKDGLMEQIGDVLGISAEEFLGEYYKHNHLTNVEGLPWIEACLSAVRMFDDSKETEEKIRNIQRDFNNSKRVNDALIEKIIELRSAGLMTAILSNFTSELRGVLREQRIDGHFDEVFVSGEMGVQKPNVAAFEMVCKGLEIESGEMVFIDDSPKSLETAEEFGYTPLLFENNEKLFTDFSELGLIR